MSDDPYADVPQVGAPPALALRLAGPYAAGYLAAIFLAGLFSFQSMTFLHEGKLKTLKRRISRVTLVTLTVLNLAYAGFCFNEAYGLMIRQNRTVAKLIEGSFTANFIPLIAGWIAALVETSLTIRAGGFITHRHFRIVFYIFQGILIFNVLLWSTTTSASGFIFSANGGEYDLPYLGWNMTVAIWHSCSAGCDTAITITLAVALRRRMSSFNASTDGVLQKLIYGAVKTASYTAFLSIACAVVSSVWTDGEISNTDINLALWLPIPPLYALSLLSTLSSTSRAVGSLGAPTPFLPNSLPLFIPPNPVKEKVSNITQESSGGSQETPSMLRAEERGNRRTPESELGSRGTSSSDEMV